MRILSQPTASSTAGQAVRLWSKPLSPCGKPGVSIWISGAACSASCPRWFDARADLCHLLIHGHSHSHSLDPSDAHLYETLLTYASRLHELGEFEAALSVWEEALAIRPDDASLLNDMGG